MLTCYLVVCQLVTVGLSVWSNDSIWIPEPCVSPPLHTTSGPTTLLLVPGIYQDSTTTTTLHTYWHSSALFAWVLFQLIFAHFYLCSCLYFKHFAQKLSLLQDLRFKQQTFQAPCVWCDVNQVTFRLWLNLHPPHSSAFQQGSLIKIS